MSVHERLKLVRTSAKTEDGKKLTQEKLAIELGVSKAYVTAMEVGNREPADFVIKAVCSKYGINEDWLRHGIGEMYSPKDESEEIAELTAKMFHESDPLRRQLAKLVFELDEDDMKALKKIWAKVKDIVGQ